MPVERLSLVEALASVPGPRGVRLPLAAVSILAVREAIAQFANARGPPSTTPSASPGPRLLGALEGKAVTSDAIRAESELA